MPTSMIDHIRRTVLPLDRADVGDGELLGRFIERRDEAALAALVKRHGPMVWGVCRRLLNHHDAEDAFQAAFIVLVRKAASVVPREMVGNWLYGVAHQAALQARRTIAKRSVREVQVTEMPDTVAAQNDQCLDVRPLLDQELSRLPGHYRATIVLCDLEGKTRKEAARHLGLPEGTVGSRLARARAMLAKRLTQRGIALSGGALAAVLAENTASAGVPTSVVSNTISAASTFAAGQAAATGPVSVKVAALTEGVLKAMMMSKLKAALAVVLILGFVATGATILACRTAAGQDDKKPTAEKSVEPAANRGKEKDNEIVTAWGKEVGGLQAGLGFRPGEKRAYSHGETVKLVVRVRNVSKEEVEFKHIWAFFVENPPRITDADGKMVQLPNYRTRDQGLHMPRSSNVAPGKEVELYEWTFDLQPNGENSSRSFIHGTGKFSLQCERIVGPTWLNPDHPNPAMNKLATGKLELEVKAAPPKPEKKQEKEGFTAWGKEVGGLQAGLGYRPGEKRAYSHGETVTLVVRVRNVSKERVQLQYLKKYFVEEPPVVTDAGGKPLSLSSFPIPKEKRSLEKLDLAPGREVEIDTMRLQLRPEDFVDQFDPIGLDPAIRGTGKFRVRYRRLAPKDIDNIGAKLATGELELEIKSDPPPAATEFPVGWGGGGEDYELSADKTVRHGGKASGSIKSIAATPLWYGTLTQAFKADKYRGQRLRMTAYVKSKDVENSAGLWMRIEGIDGKGNYSLSSDYMGDRPVKGTNDWKQYEVVLDVPKEGAAQIYFGVLLAGKGQVWVDDFKFEAVDNAVKITGRAGETGKAAVELAKGLPKEPKNLDFEQ